MANWDAQLSWIAAAKFLAAAILDKLQITYSTTNFLVHQVTYSFIILVETWFLITSEIGFCWWMASLIKATVNRLYCPQNQFQTGRD